MKRQYARMIDTVESVTTHVQREQELHSHWLMMEQDALMSLNRIRQEIGYCDTRLTVLQNALAELQAGIE